MREGIVSRKVMHCHKRVAALAKEAAAASYDELMSNDILYSTWKHQHPEIAGNPARLKRAFVIAKWGLYIEMARATLGLLLREPIDDKVKEEIVEILALDSTLIRGRKNRAVLAGTVQQQEN